MNRRLPQLDRHSSPFEVIDWLAARYTPEQVVLTTSYGMEGCALIDMFDRARFYPTIANIDTGFLFEQTRELRGTMAVRYAQFPSEIWRPEWTPSEQARDYGDQLWARDPDLCCYLRKVRPLRHNLARFQVWVTAVRRSQSAPRRQTELVQWDWSYGIVKVCPLVRWERRDVWKYVDGHQVPYNPMYREGYPSIGCTHCTRRVPGAVGPTDYSREGRWPGAEKTECGLHGYQSNGARSGIRKNFGP